LFSKAYQCGEYGKCLLHWEALECSFNENYAVVDTLQLEICESYYGYGWQIFGWEVVMKIGALYLPTWEDTLARLSEVAFWAEVFECLHLTMLAEGPEVLRDSGDDPRGLRVRARHLAAAKGVFVPEGRELVLYRLAMDEIGDELSAGIMRELTCRVAKGWDFDMLLREEDVRVRAA